MRSAEIDALPTGRELDVLVAEKVFGEAKPSGNPINTGSISGIWNCFESWGGQAWTAEFSRETHDWCFVPRPFSIDIAAAWEVVEKVWERIPKTPYGVYRFLLNRYDYNGSYVCEFALDEQGDWRTHSVGKADTAPLAICRAALKAVMKEQHDQPPER